MIKCIALDDEPLALQVIRKYIAEIPNLQLLETFTSTIQAKEFLKIHATDLIFLDIRMPEISGIQFFESLKTKPLVIFTTAYSEFAVQGFELEAVDYLVKPIKPDRFMQAVTRAEQALERGAMQQAPDSNCLFVKSGYETVRIAFKDILYIEGLDDYVKIHLKNDFRPVLSLMSRKSLTEILPPKQFLRVHRSFIIPIQLIRSVHNRHVSLGEVNIPIGDTYIKVVQEWMARH
jgi:two-component system, LytTR family, response regulator